MDTMELMKARHAVRQFIDKPLEEDAVQALNAEIEACNKEGGLHIQLIQMNRMLLKLEKPAMVSSNAARIIWSLQARRGRMKRSATMENVSF